MCDALREFMKDEIEEEKSKTKLQAIQALMKNLKLSAEQAMEAIGIPKNEYAQYLKML